MPVGERPRVEASQGDRPDRGALPQQRSDERRAVAERARVRGSGRVAISFRLDVGRVQYAAVDEGPGVHRGPVERVREVGGNGHRAAVRGQTKRGPFRKHDDRIFGRAEPDRARGDRLEHWADVGRGAGDGAEDLADRGLPLERLAQLLPRGLEFSRVVCLRSRRRARGSSRWRAPRRSMARPLRSVPACHQCAQYRARTSAPGRPAGKGSRVRFRERPSTRQGLHAFSFRDALTAV